VRVAELQQFHGAAAWCRGYRRQVCHRAAQRLGTRSRLACEPAKSLAFNLRRRLFGMPSPQHAAAALTTNVVGFAKTALVAERERQERTTDFGSFFLRHQHGLRPRPDPRPRPRASVHAGYGRLRSDVRHTPRSAVDKPPPLRVRNDGSDCSLRPVGSRSKRHPMRGGRKKL
jgi:hypothetical protein